MAGKRYVLNDQSLILLRTAVEAGISSPNELASLMGQADVETAGFTRMHEDLDYRSVEGLLRAVHSADDRFGREAVEAAVASRDPQQIAEVMYGDRPKMENNHPGDGWRFHGRGFFQFTGRYNYRTFGERYGIDLVSNPDLAADPEVSARLAVAYWLDRLSPQQRADIATAGEAINGGGNGADERVIAAHGWARSITPELVADIQAGNTTLASLAHHPVVQRVDGALSTGDYGLAVADLQQQLMRLGQTAADGRPLTPDGDFGRRTREAVESFQRLHHLDADGIAGQDTLDAIDRAGSQLLDDARHPRHPLYSQILRGVHAHESTRKITPGPHSENLAAALTVAAIREGLHRVDRVELNDTGGLARAVQVSVLRDEPGLNRTTLPVGVEVAITQPLAWTSEQARQLDEARRVQAPAHQVFPGVAAPAL